MRWLLCRRDFPGRRRRCRGGRAAARLCPEVQSGEAAIWKARCRRCLGLPVPALPSPGSKLVERVSGVSTARGALI